MIDEFKAQLFGNPALELLDVLVEELDYASGLHIDEMVVMVASGTSS